MSEGTTKPNGSREMNVEETKDVEKRISEAGYTFQVNTLQAYFSENKIQETTSDSSSTGGDKPSKAGDHTLVANKATVAFKPLIPYIANGAKAKLKGGKDKNKSNKKENNKKDRNGEKEVDNR